MKLLHIDSSITGSGSVSRQLTEEIVRRFRTSNPEVQVVRRDLVAQPLEHLRGEVFAARLQPADQRSPEQKQLVQAADVVVDEFLASDVVVLGAPMYNFGIPSNLKAWIDHICVAGKTFKYGAGGPQGLAGGKKVVIASSRGGKYGADSPMASLDHQESYLKGVLGFLGITDIEIVRAEGVAQGPEGRKTAVDGALHQIEQLPQLVG